MRAVFFSKKYLRRKLVLLTPIITALLHLYWNRSQVYKPEYTYEDTPPVLIEKTEFRPLPSIKYNRPTLNKVEKEVYNIKDFKPFVKFHRNRDRKIWLPIPNEDLEEMYRISEEQVRENLIERLNNIRKKGLSSIQRFMAFLMGIESFLSFSGTCTDISNFIFEGVSSTLTKSVNAVKYVFSAVKDRFIGNLTSNGDSPQQPETSPGIIARLTGYIQQYNPFSWPRKKIIQETLNNTEVSNNQEISSNQEMLQLQGTPNLDHNGLLHNTVPVKQGVLYKFKKSIIYIYSGFESIATKILGSVTGYRRKSNNNRAIMAQEEIRRENHNTPEEQPQVNSSMNNTPEEQPQVNSSTNNTPEEQPQVNSSTNNIQEEQPQVNSSTNNLNSDTSFNVVVPTSRIYSAINCVWNFWVNTAIKIGDIITYPWNKYCGMSIEDSPENVNDTQVEMQELGSQRVNIEEVVVNNEENANIKKETVPNNNLLADHNEQGPHAADENSSEDEFLSCEISSDEKEVWHDTKDDFFTQRAPISAY